jgi:hypothetical protein
MNDPKAIRDLLDGVRARWQRLVLLGGVARACVGVAVVLAVLFVAQPWLPERPLVLAAAALVTLALAAAASAWAFAPVRQRPSNLTLARFIEERAPTLDDRLVSAVALLQTPSSSAGLMGPMLADAAHAAAGVDASVVVPDARVRSSSMRALAAVVFLGVVLFAGRESVRTTLDATTLAFFPSRIAIAVVPGHARVQKGAPLAVEARLTGNRAPVIAQFLRAEAGANPDDEAAWHPVEMARDSNGRFHATLDAVLESFRYRVRAGGILSDVFDVTVAQAPRVARIDLEYQYPPALGLKPDTQEDSGDVYAPAGTRVQLSIRSDPAAATGQLAFAEGASVPLTFGSGGVLTGTFTIADNTSYRVALADAKGLNNPGDTEYFVRTLDDRPPDVHVIKPARDRRVTPLEEVDVEVKAEDDFGLARLELVYAVRGGAETIVPFSIPPHRTSAGGTHTIYMEDLPVRPGDFVSYYVRARDDGRGVRAHEARSDIFFLEVRPFEQEFQLAQSQMTAARGSRSVDALVAAQKEIIVATWKLDRRRQASGGVQSVADVKAVARAEADLRTRVQEASSAFRESTLRDPRQRQPTGAAPAGEDAMSAASRAMGTAATALNALKTPDALPPEMEALNHLLRAQAELKRQQISRQDAGAGGENRASEDLSSLFDRELQRQQQTNYETPSTVDNKNNGSLTDAIKDLARRQDELNTRQQALNAQSAAERQRELDRLTRDQQELRKKAEEIAKQLSQGAPSGQGAQGPQGAQGAQGAGARSDAMRRVSEDMRGAASDLQRQDPAQASQRGVRAAQRLRDLERQLRNASPDERRRALGDLQLEARQIADAQRQLAAALGQGAVGSDALRRIAGEQQGLADRTRRVQDGLRAQAAAIAGTPDHPGTQAAVGPVSRDFDRQRLPERMQQSAEQLKAAAGAPDSRSAQDTAAKAAAAQQAVAREMDTFAEQIANAREPQDAASNRLAEQRARAQRLRGEIDQLAQQLAQASKAETQPTDARGGRQTASDTGRAGRGQAGSGGAGGELARLREQYEQKIREARDLLDQLRRDDPSVSQGGAGLTFEGQGMTLSAPGTEAFKQDFAKWEQLRQQASALLQRAETSLSDRIRARSDVRLASGPDDRAPAAYQHQVDDYFKAIAKQPPR